MAADKTAPLWLVVPLTAMAGGMGWGIRGQYGHQTGAMIAGVLVGSVIAFLMLPRATSLSAARVIAFFTLGVSVGGSMTYGQTVGLTHDGTLIGNWEALRWGMLGLFLKGGIWIGIGSVLLGMALSGIRYRPAELALLLLGVLFLSCFGMQLLNEPFDPQQRLLPGLYFSDDWYFEPDGELTPRREKWGGLLFALAGMAVYARCVRADRLAFRLAGWGFVAGGIGFAGGQSIQAWHAWNPDALSQGWFAEYAPFINWWNTMETTFGAIFGAILAAGVWLNRHLIDPAPAEENVEVELSPTQEVLLLLVHFGVLACWGFILVRALGPLTELSIPMIILPVVAVTAGRYWPYMVALPVVALPIAGKTLRQMCYATEYVPVAPGWIIFLLIPMAVTLIAAIMFARWSHRQSGRSFSRWCLLLVTWLYFLLNFAFFELPWPWQPWTGRTPHGLVFAFCAFGLTAGCLFYGRSKSSSRTSTTAE